MLLYRSVGKRELGLIAESNFMAFPPRLPEQPIFYPVLSERYASGIAEKWNMKDRNSGFKGRVTRFEIEDGYIQAFEPHTVGASYHQEFWIPAEELVEFNNHIIGKIEVISTFI